MGKPTTDSFQTSYHAVGFLFMWKMSNTFSIYEKYTKQISEPSSQTTPKLLNHSVGASNLPKGSTGPLGGGCPGLLLHPRFVIRAVGGQKRKEGPLAPTASALHSAQKDSDWVSLNLQVGFLLCVYSIPGLDV